MHCVEVLSALSSPQSLTWLFRRRSGENFSSRSAPMASRICPKIGGISRRRFLKATAAGSGMAVGSGAITGFPTIWAQNIKDVVLRHNGTPVTAIPAIGEQANKDLTFKVQMPATEGNDLLNRL